ncbi:hypothetical protein H0H87_006033 [Tephrocybe sp. NHM501043]|nr:hypothetical protein H0H87_006033 [Tephrocybe sp. NHM501043]
MIYEVSLATAALTIALVLRWRQTSYRNDDVALVPGPESESFLTGNMQTLVAAPSDTAALSWSKLYGGVVKLHGVLGVRRHALLISDPAALRRIFGSSHGQWDLSSRDLASFREKFGPGIAAVEGADHVRQRRIVSQALGPSEVRGMISSVQAVSRQMRAALRKACFEQSSTGTTKMNMLDWARRCALDSLTMFAFGTTINAIDEPVKGHDILHVFDLMLEDCLGKTNSLRLFLRETASAGILPSLLGIALVDTNFFRSAMKTFKRAAQFSTWVRATREQHGSLNNGNDLLTALEKANQSDSAKYKLSNEEIVGQINMVLFAGHDTVSTSLAMLLNDLSRHPEIQQRLRAEINVKQAEIGGDEATFTQEDYDSMTYLNAVLKESMRMNPVLGQIARSNRADDVLPLTEPIQTPDGRTITEIAVSKGTWVVVDIASSNRRKDIWGEDAETFNPDRWLRTGDQAVPLGKTPGVVYGSLMNFMAGSASSFPLQPEPSLSAWRIAILELQTFICDIVQGFRVLPIPGSTVVREFHGVSIPKVAEKPIKVAKWEGPDHVRQRRIVSQALGLPEVHEMISSVQTTSRQMRVALRNACFEQPSSGTAMLDILNWARRCALESLTIHDILHAFDLMLEDCLGKTDSRLFLRKTASAGFLPSVLGRLRAEVKAKQAEIGGDQATFRVTQEDYDSMTYLNAVLKESIRMNPVLGQIARSNRADDVLPLTKPIQTSDDRIVTEIAVNKNTWAVVDIVSSNWRKDIWGEDAETFNPYRWRIAILELQTFICDIVQEFRVLPIPGSTVVREFHSVFILEKPVKGGEVPLVLEVIS